MNFNLGSLFTKQAAVNQANVQHASNYGLFSLQSNYQSGTNTAVIIQ